MKILAIETSGKVCAVALLENDVLIKEELMEDENTHSVKLMPMIDKLLKNTNTNINDIDLFACDIGPRLFYWNKNWCSYNKSIFRCNTKKGSWCYIIRKFSLQRTKRWLDLHINRC